jgi:aminoglycoside 3-N-acetyltransferase
VTADPAVGATVDTVSVMVDQAEPHTIRSLSAGLGALGLVAGDVVLLHSSRSRVGFVAGGRQAIVQALLGVLGEQGTLVVPTHTPDNTDPAAWQKPPVPEHWWPVIRDESPGFDPATTPASRWMGILAETVRTWPGALRSNHPQVSFAALGAQAATVTNDHRLDDALGDHSPLGAVYRLDGKVLLLGVGYDRNTSLHLAEWRQPDPPTHRTGSSIRQPDGSGRWVTWTDVAEDEGDFADIGADFEAAGHAVTTGRVGNATTRLMSQRALVDHATQWIAENRRPQG